MIRQFIKFGIVGISNTAVNYVMYLLVLHFIKENGVCSKYDYIFSSAAAFIAGVLWSFCWNYKYTFKVTWNQNTCKWKMLVRSIACYSVTGLFLHNILLYVWIDRLDVSKELAPALNLMVTAPLTFVLHKYWVFNRQDRDEGKVDE